LSFGFFVVDGERGAEGRKIHFHVFIGRESRFFPAWFMLHAPPLLSEMLVLDAIEEFFNTAGL